MPGEPDALAVPAEIRHLSVHRAEAAEGGFDLTLRLELVRPDGTSVGATFSGVRDLEFQPTGSNLPVTLLLSDLRDRGWEGLRWQVGITTNMLPFGFAAPKSPWSHRGRRSPLGLTPRKKKSFGRNPRHL